MGKQKDTAAGQLRWFTHKLASTCYIYKAICSYFHLPSIEVTGTHHYTYLRASVKSMNLKTMH